MQMPSWLGGFKVLSVFCSERFRWKILLAIDDQNWLGFRLGFGALDSAGFEKSKPI